MLGNIIAAAGSVLGGALNRSATADANAQNLAHAQQQMRMQEEFAKKGIRWRVADAREAGIHPLYALGAQTTSFSPVSYGAAADSSMGSAVASAGQDISRAIHSTRTADERVAAVNKTVQDLQLTKFGLENELLATQIAKLKSQIGPPMPGTVGPGGPVPEANKFEDRPKLTFAGVPIKTASDTANAQSFEDRWGEWGGDLTGLGVMARDLFNTHGQNINAMSIGEAIGKGLIWIDRNIKPFHR